MNTDSPSPTERLLRSREKLRRELHASAPAAAGPATASSTAPGWFGALKGHPGARIVIDIVENWWARHPLHLTTIVATTAATAAITPIAQKHPLGLVAGAAAVGALIVWCRPWRWSGPTLLAGVLPQLLLAAVRAAPARPDRARQA